MKIKVKPKMEEVRYQLGRMMDAEIIDNNDEQDHNFKHSGVEVTQFTLTEDSAENVEAQDHNYRHAAIYFPTSSTDGRLICV